MPKARKKAPRKPPRVETDRYVLYQKAVQSPDAEMDFVERTYRKIRGRPATRLREDFAGTGFSACEWVRRRKTHTAVALDLDPVPLAWGEKHCVGALPEEARSRVKLLRRDVLDPPPEARNVDCILAMNFSYWIFQERALMLRYFRGVREALAPGGVFFLDAYGGWESCQVTTENRRIGRFTYIWEQAHYNPITGEMHCFIHFRLANGRMLRKAFSYTWRLWTLPEIRDLLLDAGFKNPTVYWEGDDKKGGGNGIFRPALTGEQCPSWIVYITGEK